MYTSYILKAEELNEKLVKGIKESYKNKQIEIVVRELDETEYILKSDTNRKKLLKAIKNVKERKNLVKVRLKDLKKIK